MEVRFTPEQEAELSRIAAHAGTDSENFVRDAALRAIDEKNRFRSAVRDGVAQAERGELVDDAEVLRWLEEREHG
jgi:predicted transcriptional regulator